MLATGLAARNICDAMHIDVDRDATLMPRDARVVCRCSHRMVTVLSFLSYTVITVTIIIMKLYIVHRNRS